MCAKLSKLHFDVSLFSNCGEKVMKRHITMWQIQERFAGPSPRNWRITIHWNVVLTVLHTPWDMWSMWKTIGTTLKCINVLQSREEGPIYHWNSIDSGPRVQRIHLNVLLFFNPRDRPFSCNSTRQIFPSFLRSLRPGPLELEINRTLECIWKVFQTPWHTCCSWKTLGTPLWSVLFFQSRR